MLRRKASKSRTLRDNLHDTGIERKFLVSGGGNHKRLSVSKIFGFIGILFFLLLTGYILLILHKSPSYDGTIHIRDSSIKKGGIKNAIQLQMKQRLQSLPKPLWPQLDHRTAEAISSGVILGLDNTSEFNFNHTIVTAYYEFYSKHSVKEYKKWMLGLFQTSDPIIIFVEPQSTWFDVVKELRQHAPTIIAQMKFDDLVMSTTFTDEFWNYEFSIDTEAKIHHGSGVYKIWNEKLIFLYNAIHLNPFQTKGFAWVDAGYFRQMRDAPEPETPFIRINYNEEGVPEEKVLVMHVRNDPLDAIARVNVAGNSFFGTDKAFLTFYKNYYSTFYDWIAVKNKFIGSDQFVMTETCRRYASSCYPYFAGRYKSWFALSEVIMGKKKFNRGVSPHYLFLEDEPKDLQVAPEGKRITYCNDRVLPVDDCLS